MMSNPFGMTFRKENIVARCAEIEARLEDLKRIDPITDEAFEESHALIEELDELKELDPKVTYIHECHFVQHAQEVACDLVGRDTINSWPCDCIDWEQAVDALKMDYSTIELAGETYYYRS